VGDGGMSLLGTLAVALLIFAALRLVIGLVFRGKPTRPYRVVWFSPAGVPPTWLAWERHGCEAYTAVVRATGPDAATDAIFAAYGKATGYPESYTPHVVCCKEIKSPLGDG